MTKKIIISLPFCKHLVAFDARVGASRYISTYYGGKLHESFDV
jgi:hypothetical protein